jgi:hypothetical protein
VPPCVYIRAATLIRPSVRNLRLHLGVSSDSLVADSLRSGGSDTHASLQKHNKCAFRVDEGVSSQKPNSRGLVWMLLSWRRRLTPNSSPSNMRFNPDELNLWSSGETCAKNITPTSWGSSFTYAMVSVAKRSLSDSDGQLCMVIPLANARSIIYIIKALQLSGCRACPHHQQSLPVRFFDPVVKIRLEVQLLQMSPHVLSETTRTPDCVRCGFIVNEPLCFKRVNP